MNFKLNNICVPLNFSECGSNALRTALSMAIENKANLHILHVTKEMNAKQFVNVRKKIIGMLRSYVTSVKNSLYENSNLVADGSSLPVSYQVEMGNIGEKVAEFECAADIDLIIIGTNKIVGLKQLGANNPSMEILKNTTRPIITVPKQCAKRNFESVLYSIPNTSNSFENFEYLTPFLVANHPRLHLLAIYNKGNNRDGHELTHKMKDLCDTFHNSVKISCETVSSEALSQTISEVARRKDCDLIVVTAAANQKQDDICSSRGYTNRLINDSILPILRLTPARVFPMAGLISNATTNSRFSFTG